jgi:hypothetical protein
MFAQEQCKSIEIEKENIELAKNIFSTETKDKKINGDSYVSKLSAMSDDKFNALCDRFEYNPYFEQAKKNNPDLSSYVMYAENLTGVTNLFCAMLDYKKEIENLPQDVKKRLQTIDNTIKLYKDLQDALSKEMRYNNEEIIDNGINLAIKHVEIFTQDVSIPGFSDLNKYTANLIGAEIIQSAKDGMLDKRPQIDNLVADKMNEGFTWFERAAVLVPPLRVITEYPYYKIFASLPEIGKGIGHAAAVVNIYFRKNEYENLITELEKEKQYILTNKTTGPVMKSRY